MEAEVTRETTKELTKKCTKCSENKELSEYTKHSHQKDGLDTVCKACRSEYRTKGKGRALKALHNAQRRRQAAEKALNEEITDTLTSAQVEEIQNEKECAYCQTALSEQTVTIDHVIPMSEGGANSYENVVACCRTCNTQKSNEVFYEFIQSKFNRQTELRFVLMLAKKYGLEIDIKISRETIKQCS